MNNAHKRVRSFLGRTANFRADSKKSQRYDKRDALIASCGGPVRCPECNADLVHMRYMARHKRAGCAIFPGAREKLATLIAAYLMERFAA